MTVIWRPDSGEEDVFTFGEFTNYLDLFEEGLKLNLCSSFPKGIPTPTFSSEGAGDPTDHFMASGAFIASERLKSLIESFNVSAEYVPVELTHNGSQWDSSKFFIVNLLEAVSCLDYESSSFAPTPSGITNLDNLVIDEAIASGHHLFMLGPIPWGNSPNPKAISEIIRCASEDFAARCLKDRISGVAFTRPNDRNAYPPPLWIP